MSNCKTLEEMRLIGFCERVDKENRANESVWEKMSFIVVNDD